MIFTQVSNKIVLGINKDPSPYSSVIDGWSITEKYYPKEYDKSRDLGYYELIITSEVNNLEELTEKRTGIRPILDQLDILLLYLVSIPLTFESHFPKLDNKREMIFFVDDPDGWNTNYNEIEDLFHKKGGGLIIKIQPGQKSQHWCFIDNLPLKQLLRIRQKYLKTIPIIKALINLHYLGIKAYGDLRFFAYGKALEIVRSLLPGKSDKEKEKNLPPEVHELFDGTKIRWLMSITNNRYETRHIIKNPDKYLLHQEMTSEEFKTFSFLADNLFRTIVLDHFNEKIIIFTDN